VAKPALGNKRVCPETGRKFYDLNKDPIVSPYTGKSYPLSYFNGPAEIEEEETAVELDAELETVETVSLEEADEEAGAKQGEDDALPDIDGDEEIDLGDEDEDDTFLAAEEEDEDEDVSGILGGGRAEGEEDL
jgi:uncharacterized protein (TIGR02300 family)